MTTITTPSGEILGLDISTTNIGIGLLYTSGKRNGKFASKCITMNHVKGMAKKRVYIKEVLSKLFSQPGFKNVDRILIEAPILETEEGMPGYQTLVWDADQISLNKLLKEFNYYVTDIVKDHFGIEPIVLHSSLIRTILGISRNKNNKSQKLKEVLKEHYDNNYKHLHINEDLDLDDNSIDGIFCALAYDMYVNLTQADKSMIRKILIKEDKDSFEMGGCLLKYKNGKPTGYVAKSIWQWKAI